MNFDEYQKEAAKFAKDEIKENLPYLALGLVGESGEIAEKIKKLIRDDFIDGKAVIAELGDVLWYLSQLANYWGVSFEHIAQQNIDKLSSRQARGVISGSGDNR